MEVTDRPMNSFATVTDASCIYIELANGSQGKIRKSDLIELIRANMPIATVSTKGLMDKNNIRTFTPMQQVYIDPGKYIEVEEVCGLFILTSRYSSGNPAIYVVSTIGGLMNKILNEGPGIATLINGKIRINNPYSVQIDVQYCYQNIGR